MADEDNNADQPGDEPEVRLDPTSLPPGTIIGSPFLSLAAAGAWLVDRLIEPLLRGKEGVEQWVDLKRGELVAWVSGGEEWERVMIRATACPRISPAFLDEAKLRLGPALFDNEFNCEFLLSTGGLFDPEALRRMFDVPASDWAARLAEPSPGGEEAVTGAEAVLW